MNTLVSTLLILATASTATAADLKTLSLIVLSDSTSGRGDEYARWLAPLVKHVSVVHYSATAIPARSSLVADVVLLDWDQSTAGSADGHWVAAVQQVNNPLGDRASWRTPTVVLGSAGLMVAMTWSVAGDRGCTCLTPFAYDLRDHPVTRGPLAIDRSTPLTVPTPVEFAELHRPTIDVLPLVDGTPSDKHWDPGWCVYYERIASMPDVEWIGGGINAEEPAAAAIWRQGDLMHFGFQQTPRELNDNGRHLLANAIAYIADFHQDLPIATEEIGAHGHAYLGPRPNVVRWLTSFKKYTTDGSFPTSILGMLDTDERARVVPLATDDAGFKTWCADRLPYLHPDPTYHTLSVDADLLAAKTPFDSEAFLDLLERRLADAHDPVGQRLLRTYVPQAASGAGAVTWLHKNRRYLFPTEAGGYRWYIDPLAQSRQVPSRDLRGPGRSDTSGTACKAGTVCTP